jgi:hypothetical protein
VNARTVKCESSIPGPQTRGTGGTLIVVWKGRRDRGHPPMNGAQLLMAQHDSSGLMTGPPAANRAIRNREFSCSTLLLGQALERLLGP